jgi:hypothetical protein
MRAARILMPILLALAVVACARQQQEAYYLIDPGTGQPVPMAQRYGQPGQPQYAQAGHPQQHPQAAYPQSQQPQQAQASNRGLFSSPQAAQQAYAQPQYVQPAYQPPPQQDRGNRGLFAQPRQQAYAAPPPAYGTQNVGTQNVVMQYRRPPAAGGPYVTAAPPPAYGYSYPAR